MNNQRQSRYLTDSSAQSVSAQGLVQKRSSRHFHSLFLPQSRLLPRHVFCVTTGCQIELYRTD